MFYSGVVPAPGSHDNGLPASLFRFDMAASFYSFRRDSAHISPRLEARHPIPEAASLPVKTSLYIALQPAKAARRLTAFISRVRRRSCRVPDAHLIEA